MLELNDLSFDTNTHHGVALLERDPGDGCFSAIVQSPRAV
jgi:hypothetical protein